MTGFENVLKYFELLCKMKIKKPWVSLHYTLQNYAVARTPHITVPVIARKNYTQK